MKVASSVFASVPQQTTLSKSLPMSSLLLNDSCLVLFSKQQLFSTLYFI